MTIPYGRQDIDAADIAAVEAVLRSDWLTQGPAVPEFERAVADYCGAPHAVACSSATAALHLACLAAGMGPGDLGWTSPNTFVASANAMLYCGGRPEFVDIEAATWNLDLDLLEARLAAGGRPKAVIPVHFAGLSCDMERLGGLASRYGFTVIEDAAHALGGRYRGRPVGGCAHADMAVFSFHAVKNITTGEGGMILTRRRDLYERLLRLRSHGISREPALLERPDEGGWWYEQGELGYHYRLTDIQAALGSSQLRRLDAFLARRRALAARYRERLAGLPLASQGEFAGADSAWHIYPVRLGEGIDRRRIFEAMRAAGIGVNVHYIPVYRQPHYRRLGYPEGLCPQAEAYYRQALTLPLHPGLTDAEQDRVVAALTAALGASA
jgi:UDP-4-amino-4,6-dideoxy-N-acetyl-beta-L-altrosamine transaminase